MSANHRHYQNVVPVTRLLIGIAIAGFICCSAIFYVWSRNQIDLQGRAIKERERELVKLQKELEVVQGQIAVRSSIDTLQQSFRNGAIRMQHIAVYEPTDRIQTADANELRNVSNPNRRTRP